MKDKIFTVYDSKIEAYLQPFFQKATPQALRTFTDMVNNPDHPFHSHAEDYTLFELGVYDETNGRIEWQEPHSITNGLEVKNGVTAHEPWDRGPTINLKEEKNERENH